MSKLEHARSEQSVVGGENSAAPPAARLRSEAAARARRTALAITARLREDARLLGAIEQTSTSSAYPMVNVWRSHSLAYGDAGLAVTCAAADRADPDAGWDILAHRFIASAVAGLPSAPGLGLLDGACGVAFAAAFAGRGRRYTGLVTELDERIARQVEAHSRHMSSTGPPLPIVRYDLISGAAGWATYLAGRPSTPSVDAALGSVGRLLSSFAELDPAGTPRLALPARILSPELAELAPAGYVDCGVAHGYPGVLAALLTIRTRGGAASGALDDVLHGGAQWLSHQLIQDDAAGAHWPYRLILGDDGPARTSTQPRPRDGWCYGVPGVAHVLWSLGAALDEPAYRHTAITVMRSACARVLRGDSPLSPTLCHGRAGLLLVTAALARDSGCAELRVGSNVLLDQLLAEYDEEATFGYRDVENAGMVTDNPGVLSGAPGVALALLAASTDTSPPTPPSDGSLQWLGSFGLSGAGAA
jgi:hypothetical protein